MRIVVKVGTSTLSHRTGNLNLRRIEELCKVLSDIKNAGHEVLLVSSGATGMGVGKLGLTEKPEDIAGKQAAAAVGQCELMYTYDQLFEKYGHCVAQILVTRMDVEDETHRENLRSTIFKLLSYRALPIINENDSVATEEFFIGENDTLAALVAGIVDADLIVLLSDIDGLFTADPHKDPDARLIPEVRQITQELFDAAGGPGSMLASGGMYAKLKAAEIAMDVGCDLIIASGLNLDVLYDIMDGKQVGTKFYAGGKKS